MLLDDAKAPVSGVVGDGPSHPALVIHVKTNGSGDAPVYVSEPFGSNLSNCIANNRAAVTVCHNLPWDRVPPSGLVGNGHDTPKVTYTELSVPAEDAEADGSRMVACDWTASSLWRRVHDGHELSLPVVTSVTDAKVVDDCRSVPTNVSAIITVDNVATFEHATLERHAFTGNPLAFDQYAASAADPWTFATGTCAHSTPRASIVYDTDADARWRDVRNYLIPTLWAVILGVVGSLARQLIVRRKPGRHSESS